LREAQETGGSRGARIQQRLERKENVENGVEKTRMHEDERVGALLAGEIYEKESLV